MTRRSKLTLNKSINLHCLYFLKTHIIMYKRFLPKGQFRNVMFETVFLNNLAWVAGKYIKYNS